MSYKITITGIFSAFALYFHQLFAPLFILIIVMGADYITGVVSAWYTRTLSSRTGIIGIVKKCCYLIAVLVGMVADYGINTLGKEFNSDFSTVYAVSVLVTVWLIVNESISILENLEEIGVPFPGWLKKIMERLEKKIDEEEDDAE